MKTLLMASVLLLPALLQAQSVTPIATNGFNNNTSRSSVIQAAPMPNTGKPAPNPYQAPNFYQNNSMYNNNSMQYNKPDTTNTFPGNGQYYDRTRPQNSFNPLLILT